MRFQGVCFRAHDPRHAADPISGEGASFYGGRFNPKGMPALYLALDFVTAVKEANQGLAYKIKPCVLCSYNVDCDDVADLRSESSRIEHSISLEHMACAWFLLASENKEPPSWTMARRLIAQGFSGALVPSFAPGAALADTNLVLWQWSETRPHHVEVFDPEGRVFKKKAAV